jgi:hypothetical protein
MANRCRSTVSTQLETANVLVGIGNYAGVSVFRIFPGRATRNLKTRFRWSLAQFKLHSLFPKNLETAKQRSVSAANTGTYLFHRALKQPEPLLSRWES